MMLSIIASVMDYGLSEESLSKLALIHKNAPKGSKRRAVIEQLLEDINYHSENSDFNNHCVSPPPLRWLGIKW